MQLGRVRVGPDGAGEVDGPRHLVFVPREQIVQIESIRAVGGERPIITLILGIALIAFSVLPLIALVNVFQRGGMYHASWIAGIACVIPGIWLVELSVRKRWVLLVTTHRGTRKLLFPRGTTESEAGMFTASARSVLS